LSYQDSPLAEEHRPNPGLVRAGDRASDAPCGPVRIFDVLRGPHPTLLAFDAPEVTCPGLRVVHIAAPGTLPAQDTVVDTDGHAHRAYDITNPTLLLVRPDNYIGCAAPATNLSAIAAYGNRIAPPRIAA